ncbi:hypothetical protein TNCV_2310311 [Trichonephila clavipes]|nr:hypothetical protein TNCV_2310311 [Trichonephila clavipes]
MQNNQRGNLKRDVRLDLIFAGITAAQNKLRGLIKDLENCKKYLSILIHSQREDLIAIMEEQPSTQDLRSLLQEQFNDADYLIGLIQRSRGCLTGHIQHPELLPSARIAFQRLYF